MLILVIGSGSDRAGPAPLPNRHSRAGTAALPILMKASYAPADGSGPNPSDLCRRFQPAGLFQKGLPCC